MAAKEKLAMLERERTKKEKEKIQAERKRKAAQFLASMKIVSSSNKNSSAVPRVVNSETASILDSCSSTYFYIIVCIFTVFVYSINFIFIDSPLRNSVAINTDQKPPANEKNGLPDDDMQVIIVQSSSKVQDIISIGSRYRFNLFIKILSTVRFLI